MAGNGASIKLMSPVTAENLDSVLTAEKPVGRLHDRIDAESIPSRNYARFTLRAAHNLVDVMSVIFKHIPCITRVILIDTTRLCFKLIQQSETTVTAIGILPIITCYYCYSRGVYCRSSVHN